MPGRMIIAMLAALSLSTACAQEPWEEYNDAGMEAQEQARYAEAEELYLAALKEAESFGEQDTRLHVSSPLLDLRERSCGPEPQDCKENSEQARYRHCACPLFPRAQTNGRRFTIVYWVDGNPT